MGVINAFPDYYYPWRIEPTVDYFHTLDPDQPQPFVDLLGPSFSFYTPTFLQPGQTWSPIQNLPLFGDYYTPSQLGAEPEPGNQVSTPWGSNDFFLLPDEYYRYGPEFTEYVLRYDPLNPNMPPPDQWLQQRIEEDKASSMGQFTGPFDPMLGYPFAQTSSGELPPYVTEADVRAAYGGTAGGGAGGGGGSGYYVPSWQDYNTQFGRLLDRLASQWLSQLMGILGLGSTGAEAGPQIPDWLRRRMETQLYFPLFGIPQAP